MLKDVLPQILKYDSVIIAKKEFRHRDSSLALVDRPIPAYIIVLALLLTAEDFYQMPDASILANGPRRFGQEIGIAECQDYLKWRYPSTEDVESYTNSFKRLMASVCNFCRITLFNPTLLETNSNFRILYRLGYRSCCECDIFHSQLLCPCFLFHMSTSDLYPWFDLNENLQNIYGGTSSDGRKRGRSHHPLPPLGLSKSCNILFNLGLPENFKNPKLDYILSCTRPLLQRVLKKQNRSLTSEPSVNRDKAGLIMKIVGGTNLGKDLIAQTDDPPNAWSQINAAASNPAIASRDPNAAAVGTDTVPIPNVHMVYGPYPWGEDEEDPDSCVSYLLKPFEGGHSNHLGVQCDHLALAITHVAGDKKSMLSDEFSIAKVTNK